MIFNIQKCSDDLKMNEYPESKCAQEDKVNELIENLSVEVWTLTE